jgi:hypothetical protein
VLSNIAYGFHQKRLAVEEATKSCIAFITQKFSNTLTTTFSPRTTGVIVVYLRVPHNLITDGTTAILGLHVFLKILFIQSVFVLSNEVFPRTTLFSVSSTAFSVAHFISPS